MVDNKNPFFFENNEKKIGFLKLIKKLSNLVKIKEKTNFYRLIKNLETLTKKRKNEEKINLRFYN